MCSSVAWSATVDGSRIDTDRCASRSGMRAPYGWSATAMSTRPPAAPARSSASPSDRPPCQDLNDKSPRARPDKSGSGADHGDVGELVLVAVAARERAVALLALADRQRLVVHHVGEAVRRDRNLVVVTEEGA